MTITPLNFLTPVTYLPTPSPFFGNPWNKTKELVDNYFCYEPGFRAYEIEEKDGIHHVQLIYCKSNPLLTAVKLTSLATPIFPLMLMVKVYARYNTTLNVINPNPSKERSPLEPIFYKLHSTTDKTAIDKCYTAIFQKQGSDYSKGSSLQRHAVFFADNEGNFTKNSIQDGFERLRCWKITSYAVAYLLFPQIAKALNEKGSRISLNEINKAKHSSDTQVFSENGEFNAEKFQGIVSVLNAPNSPFPNANNVNALVYIDQERDRHLADSAKGATASKKEFNMTLNLFSDCALVTEYGGIRKGITEKRLHAFYTNGPELFEEVAVTSRKE